MELIHHIDASWSECGLDFDDQDGMVDVLASCDGDRADLDAAPGVRQEAALLFIRQPGGEQASEFFGSGLVMA
jgi:hypothetical protein